MDHLTGWCLVLGFSLVVGYWDLVIQLTGFLRN